MSLLRPRAIDVSAESTLSAARPALARERLVREISSCSDAELNVPASQPSAATGIASTPTVVRAKAAVVMRARRLSTPGRAVGRAVRVDGLGCDIAVTLVLRAPGGGPVWFQP